MKHLKSPERAGIDLAGDRRLEWLTAEGWVFGSFTRPGRSAGAVPRLWLVVGCRGGRFVQGADRDEAKAWERVIADASRPGAGGASAN